MSWKFVKIKKVLKQYRVTHIVENDREYKQVTISKHDGVKFRGTKKGKDIGRKRQFIIDLKQHPNTLMLVRQGVYEGAIGIAPPEVDECIATENMPMFSIEGINIDYLNLIIQSPYFKEELEKIPTTGSAQKSIHERQILEIEIPYPSQEEQELIVDSFKKNQDALNAITTELTHQLDLVKQLRQAFLREAMQGKLVPQDVNDEPASVLLEKIKAEKESLIKEKKIRKQKPLPPITEDEIPFDIPKNWVWCRLGELSNDLLGGFAFKSSKYVKESKNQVIRLGNVKNDNLLLNANPAFVTDDYASTAEKARLLPGDILVTMTGTRAKRDYLFTLLLNDEHFENFNLYLNQRVGAFRLNDLLKKEYITFLLKEPLILEPVFLSSTGAANQANIGVTALNNILVPLPPLSEQQRIVAKLDELMQYCDDLEASIKESQQQNELLLQQVLREALEPKEKEVERV